MTPFEIIVTIALLTIAIALMCIAGNGGFKIQYEKKVIQENHMDEVQLEIAKRNIAALEKYNENAAKSNNDTVHAIQTMTAAVQDLMGVENETRK